ncbi:MAG: hypothetical protein JO284_09570 [Planctomycetaceae bacterium]|nr:hypothetical protein [Planctomycetaceae bacterium]MBV8268572.1 hypothetical protein [Planctomycetaceae bacterium]MBV8318197.1 hypothetical protein [Planctomycetaceae bacterium]
MGTIMRDGDRGPQPSRRHATDPAVVGREHPAHGSGGPDAAGWVIEAVVSPFHCLYQDALHFHTQSQLWLARSEGESSRLARAALLLYLASAEALVHQAAVELGRPELAKLAADPDRPLPLADAWRLLPAIVADVHAGPYDPSAPPWPQFAELLALRTTWAYPGPPAARRAYYRSPRRDAAYEPLEPHQVPPGLAVPPDRLHFPKTGLPRDPYALRPRHLDTARGILDSAIEALDRRLGGALTDDQRHRKEPVRVVYPSERARES